MITRKAEAEEMMRRRRNWRIEKEGSLIMQKRKKADKTKENKVQKSFGTVDIREPVLKKSIGQEEPRIPQLEPDRFPKPNMPPESAKEDQGEEK